MKVNNENNELVAQSSTDKTILPCPFCGAEITDDSILDASYENTSWFGVMIVCQCGVTGRTFSANSGYQEAKGEAIAAWNKRV